MSFMTNMKIILITCNLPSLQKSPSSDVTRYKGLVVTWDTLIFRTPDLSRICELPFAALIFITADIAAYNEDDMMSQCQHVERFNQMTNHVTTSSSNVTSRIFLIYPDINAMMGNPRCNLSSYNSPHPDPSKLQRGRETYCPTSLSRAEQLWWRGYQGMVSWCSSNSVCGQQTLQCLVSAVVWGN